MMGSFPTRVFIMAFGYAYPAYECFKTVERNKPDVEQLQFWCQYWILVAVLSVFERVGDAFVSWLPLYSEAKLAFFIFLWYPKTRGTTYVYDTFLRPYVLKHETEIDRNLLELRARAVDIVVVYWQKAASYGQTRFFDILNFVASQSQPSRPPPVQIEESSPCDKLVSGAKRVPPKVRKQKLLDFLQERYEPVDARWTTERCAICRWVEDWDYNKIIICNRCQIAVHQECYGVRSVQDFTSWVCRACETPHIKRECCLCRVKGGALKRTDVDELWVHVTCALFKPEVSFASDELMEPALGILNIPSESFVKICVICKQMHGSCTQCYRCSTYYHAMCA